jgi:hypothetical protein
MALIGFSVMRYLVSYQLFSTQCGNRAFDSAIEARAFIATNRQHWKSFSTFTFSVNPGAISELTPVTLE